MDNAQLAYLLGMIAGKGTIRRNPNDTDVIIEIPHKNIISEGMDAALSVKASLIDIKNNLEPLIGATLTPNLEKNKTTIKFVKINEDYLIREINRHFQNFNSCKDFRIPEEIFNSPNDIKKEFMLGLGDVTAHIRSSNVAFKRKDALHIHGYRTYIEIPVNWYMVVDIGNLLTDLNVPIHNIDWAHPNMRDSNLKQYNKGNKMFWYKEHQIKIFADEYEQIGFKIDHKMKALKTLADKNREEYDKDLKVKMNDTDSDTRKEKYKNMIGHIDRIHHKYYWETREVNKEPKPVHPMESSDKIPVEIRGKHFDSWKAISDALGYRRK
ncbi:MAG: hypothetical protein LHV68_13025 [Elusimicrobia bacterium]|nr:hypothetical protein [Candidatus Liberimonas magnetica]